VATAIQPHGKALRTVHVVRLLHMAPVAAYGSFGAVESYVLGTLPNINQEKKISTPTFQFYLSIYKKHSPQFIRLYSTRFRALFRAVKFSSNSQLDPIETTGPHAPMHSNTDQLRQAGHMNRLLQSGICGVGRQGGTSGSFGPVETPPVPLSQNGPTPCRGFSKSENQNTYTTVTNDPSEFFCLGVREINTYTTVTGEPHATTMVFYRSPARQMASSTHPSLMAAVALQ
jgi:hypothetical protein